MQTLQDNELFQTGYLVDGLWKTLITPLMFLIRQPVKR